MPDNTRSIALHVIDFKNLGEMILIRLIIFSTLFFSNIDDNIKNTTLFISPLKIPQFLSANFGELRIDHFHSGLDIKTNGVTGQEVVAASDGYIAKITVTPGGFGNALYIIHPNGYETVYGHLERFNPEIEKYVKALQYEKKSFSVILFPTKDLFPVKQGDLIAYSGNSGASGGPHLHFEIRKSGNEKPLNPLFFDPGIRDKIKPIIERIIIYPASRNTLIDNLNQSKKLSVTGSNGKYQISTEKEINVSGPACFGIKAYDLEDEGTNRCTVYSLELKIDSISKFKYVMDGFLFTESRYVNSHIDYETFIKENTHFERLHVLPNDKLSTYKSVTNRGLFNFNDDKTHKVEIIVSDENDNKSVLTFHVKAHTPQPEILLPPDKNVIMMPFGKENNFTADNISVNIPEGALFDTLYFSYKKENGTKEMLSELHYVHNRYTPVQKPVTISIKPTITPHGKQSKMLVVRMGPGDSKIACNSTWSGGSLTTDVYSFGNYYIGIDTVKPEISTGLVKGSDLTGRKELRFKITDELSGIRSYEGIIDGKWALFEYDQKNDLLVYKFDEARITKGSKHTLLLQVSDNKSNTNTFKSEFTW